MSSCTLNGKKDSVSKDYHSHFSSKPKLLKFKSNHWVLQEDMIFYMASINTAKEKQASITVPAGFVTNLTSFPLIREKELYIPAAIVHDYMYWVHSCGNTGRSKAITDKIYQQALKANGVNNAAARAMMEVVAKTPKYGPWNNNYRRGLRGESRFVPKDLWNKVSGVRWRKFANEANLQQRAIEKKEEKHRIVDDICHIFPNNSV